MTDALPPSTSATQWALQLAGIIEIAADAIISTDQHLTITLFNHGAEQIFGYARDEVTGRPLDILLPDRFRAAHADHVHRFQTAAAVARRMGERQEIFARHRDGHEFPAEASISKLDIDGNWTFTVVLRDITARLEHERTLKASEARLSLALVVGRVGLFEHDYKAGKLFWSPTLREILGVGPDELATVETFFTLIPPHVRTVLENAMMRARDPGGDGVLSMEHQIVRRDGQSRWIAYQAQMYFEGAGATATLVREIGAVRDVTERKEAERELEARVEQRTSELRAETARRSQAQAALSRAQRMEAFGQLAGGIAHDFNNLLTVITGNQELLEMRLEDAKDLALLKRAQEAADMGARLTGRLLTFARRRQLEPTHIQMNDAVMRMVDLLRRTLGEPVDLHTALDPMAWTVRADASEIENAILNLAINARDAMPDGGRLMIETANVVIEPDDPAAEIKLPPGDYLRLAVSDTGVGMPLEVLQKVFEPFFTTKAPGKGTGLGLSTIFGFVQQSGGTVTIYSEVDRGTTVNVYLPRADEPGRAARRSTLAASVPLSAGETVLLVEDNPEVRQVTRQRLEHLGYTVNEADSGAVAIEILKQGAVADLVFSDVVMAGGLSGFDVVRWIRQCRPSLKVLLASGYPGDILRDSAPLDPPVTILRKPYTRSGLALSLRRALDT